VGFRLAAAMDGLTTGGGAEAVVVMQKASGTPRYQYRLLPTTLTWTMQKEISEAAAAGFSCVGQTVFRSSFGGQEVVCILEPDRQHDASADRCGSLLVATKLTSTMEKELDEVGEKSFQIVGMTVGRTEMRGLELVSILRPKLY